MQKGDWSGMLTKPRSYVVLYKAFDALCIVGVLALAVGVYEPADWNNRFSLFALMSLVVFYFFSEIAVLHKSWRGVDFHVEFVRMFVVWSGTVLVVLMLAYASKTTADYSRVVVGAWMLMVPAFMTCWRLLLRFVLKKLRSSGYNIRTAVVAGAGEMGVRVADTLQNAPWIGMRFIGFFDDIGDDNEDDSGPDNEHITWDGALQGNLDDLVERAHRKEMDVIYIALPLTEQSRIKALLHGLADTTASVYLVPDLFVYNLLHGQWMNLSGLPAVSVFDRPFLGMAGCCKRCQDVLLASVFLIITALPMVMIAIAVKLTSPGPVLYKQRRYGIDGKEILVYKFRSMFVQDESHGVRQACRSDERITPVGAFLRRTSLDELPQFFNVLFGSMSIVGPRPHALEHNQEYRSLITGYMLRHAVKPGITGWAQVNGWRGETETLNKMEKRVEHDLWYIRNWSFWLDIKIVYHTMIYMFFTKNAY